MVGNPYMVGSPHTWWPGHHVCGLPTMYGFPTMYLGSPPCIWVPHHVFRSMVSGIRYLSNGLSLVCMVPRITRYLGVRDNPVLSYIRWLFRLQQLNLFFLCFSAARLLCSSFFWTDYFMLSCILLATFLVMYALFVFIGSLAVPMFAD